jgi:hypothetical protein
VGSRLVDLHRSRNDDFREELAWSNRVCFARAISFKIRRTAGGGAFLDGYVNVAGHHWNGVTLVHQLIPVVPSGTEVILVPDPETAALYPAATSTEGGVAISRGTHMRILSVVISVIHPRASKSPRAHVRILDGRASGKSGWMDLTNLAIEGLKPDGQNDTTVNDKCRC